MVVVMNKKDTDTNTDTGTFFSQCINDARGLIGIQYLQTAYRDKDSK